MVSRCCKESLVDPEESEKWVKWDFNSGHRQLQAVAMKLGDRLSNLSFMYRATFFSSRNLHSCTQKLTRQIAHSSDSFSEKKIRILRAKYCRQPSDLANT
jgi:hypothetical protein